MASLFLLVFAKPRDLMAYAHIHSDIIAKRVVVRASSLWIIHTWHSNELAFSGHVLLLSS
jgi:hypothetical protein